MYFHGFYIGRFDNIERPQFTKQGITGGETGFRNESHMNVAQSISKWPSLLFFFIFCNCICLTLLGVHCSVHRVDHCNSRGDSAQDKRTVT